MSASIQLTDEMVAGWRQKVTTLETEIRTKNEQLGLYRRKIEAAELLLTNESGAAEVTAKPNLVVVESHHEDEGESVSMALRENLVSTGDSLKVAQIRARLAQLGFKDKAEHPNYVYGLVYRLTKNGHLLKRGSRYRAPPPVPLQNGAADTTGASAA